MINLLLGAPGGGKSYEANVFHILEALKQGRKVITNLPVNVDAYAAIDPAFRGLLEVRTRPQPIRGRWDPGAVSGAYQLFEDGHVDDPPQGARVFGGVWDYFDTWRHPEKGFGPLYVIDECHLALPAKATDRAVEEWYSLHRHFNVDVLLLTQSYGKISAAIRDLVQIVYRVRKNVALGSTSSYTRKVQDGLRGAVMNETIRRYKPEYFKLYRSHTQGVATDELNASDVKPLWKHWSVYGAIACFTVVGLMAASGEVKNPLTQAQETIKGQAGGKVKQEAQRVTVSTASQSHAAPAAPPASAVPASVDQVEGAAADPEPYADKMLHLTGLVEFRGRKVWTLVVSQSGVVVERLTSVELEQAGYKWRGLSACAGIATFGRKSIAVTCDAPAMQLNVPSPGKDSGKAGEVSKV
ncbi:MAG TPA: zonular occludens toxin domain-containing protein [Burkholderiaceae bacterium]|nr:zonular occludens toxin domain-containing protein [Burkholderiaceae bacterium]